MSSHVLMCEPVHYQIVCEITPWMRRSTAVDRPRAASQWRLLYEALAALGVRIELVPQGPEVPDMTFTANAGIVSGRRFFPANFRFPERQPEATRFVRWFREQGYSVESVHEPHYWEGEGDVLPANGRVFAGYRWRTELRAIDHLDELLDTSIVRLELVDPRFYHLDTCFCPLGGGSALYYPPAFSAQSRALLDAHFDDLIAVGEQDALRFACNALVVNDAVVLNTGCRATAAALQERSLRAVEVPTDEFIKAGGSVKCLVLTLDRYSTPSGSPSA